MNTLQLTKGFVRAVYEFILNNCQALQEEETPQDLNQPNPQQNQQNNDQQFIQDARSALTNWVNAQQDNDQVVGHVNVPQQQNPGELSNDSVALGQALVLPHPYNALQALDQQVLADVSSNNSRGVLHKIKDDKNLTNNR